MRLSCLLLLALGGLALGQSKDEAFKKAEAIKKDKDQLQGPWSIISVTNDGKDERVEKLVNAKLIFKGDVVVGQVIRFGKGNECTFRLDPSLKIKGIDVIDQDKNVRQLIYQLDDNKLKIARNNRDSARPTTFDSKPGTGITLLILRRDKTP